MKSANTSGDFARLKTLQDEIKKLESELKNRRLAEIPSAVPPSLTLPDLTPALSASAVLLIILPLLYLFYVLVIRRTRAPKRTQRSRADLHGSNPHGIYEPVEPYFDFA